MSASIFLLNEALQGVQISLTLKWADEPSWPEIKGDLNLYNIDMLLVEFI